MMARGRLLAVSALALWTVGVSLTAQTPTPAATTQGPTPTFRAGVKLVDLDVYVTDKDGHFVKDLTREDFEIREDGKPQDLQAFTFVDLPVETRVTTQPASGPEPDVVTNRSVDGRLYVLLLDSESTRGCPGNAYVLLVRRLVNRFIDEALQDGDLVAVVHAQGTFRDAQPFTSSKALLHASANRYGLGVSSDDPTRDAITKQIDSFRAIEDLANRLGSITGRRKSIVWMGAQMRFEAPVCPPSPGPGDPCPPMAARWPNVLVASRGAMAAANRNNVSVYPIDPCGLTTALGEEELDRLAALRVVAEDTGGLAVVNTNNFRDGFTNVVRDNSTYYVLGYVPGTEYRDGKFHAVTVRVKRPGYYTVRQRKGYVAPAPDSRTPDVTAAPSGASAAAREALRLPISTRGLNVSLFNAPFKGEGGEQSVVIGGHVSGDLLLDGARQVGLSYQVFTQDNHVQVGEYKTFTLTLQPDSRTSITANGLHFVDRLSLPPGRYELRYAVDQPGGHVGSVVAPLIVPKFDEALSISGVVLASEATSEHFMLRDDAGIRERLGANPTSVRVFHRSDRLNAFSEVYSDDERLTADDLTVTGSLTTTDGKPVSSAEARLRSAERPGDGRWAYTVEVGLDDVPAGSYVFTVEAASTGRKDPVRHSIPINVED
jgi:VWFA-related protein